jgi:hypothetical protein
MAGAAGAADKLPRRLKPATTTVPCKKILRCMIYLITEEARFAINRGPQGGNLPDALIEAGSL